MVVGILFIVIFIGGSLLGQALGFWHLPGQVEADHTEGGTSEGETHQETAAPAELHGYMNLKEYLTKFGADLECFAAKIGVSVEELNIEAKELSHSKGFEMENFMEFAKECKGQAQDQTNKNNVASLPQDSSKEESNAEDNVSKKTFDNKDVSEIINDLDKVGKESSEEIKKMLEEARNKGEVPIPGDMTALPFLKGSDNLKKYCTDNGISMECLAQKLGIQVSELDNNAKDIAAKLSTGHVEQIREVMPGCIDYTR